MKKIVGIAILGLGMTACGTSKEQVVQQSASNDAVQSVYSESVALSAPNVCVYKTKADYYNLVPVLMDDARSRIVAYPHPTDLKKAGEYRLPVRLSDGYLLDNKGINRNVAFLSYTYEEYAKMKSAPSMDEMMSHIKDRNPLTEWHKCGRRTDYRDIVAELNELIKKGFK